MKKVYIASVQPDVDGPVFGRNLNPADFMKAQDFGHKHVEQITRDLLVAGAAGAQVAGFAATLTAGLGVSIAKGDVVDQNGVCYETDQADDGPSVVAMAAAHVSLPRIDLIVATLSIDTPVLSEFESFRRLRTDAELEARLDPYPPTQYETPTEQHTRATIVVKTGVPNASPAAPVAGAGEVPLWQVHVAAGQVTLGGGDLTSVRALMRSLYQVIADLDTTAALVATLNAAAELLAHKGQVNGYAALDSAGKVPFAQLPAIVISDVFTVASQAAMLALTAERGDLAIRTDINQTFALSAEPATTLGNWKQLLFPSPVVSFNTRTGAVTLLSADVTGALGFTPVASFNTRTGDVTLTNGDVIAALGYSPVNKAGDIMTGRLEIDDTNGGHPQYQTPRVILRGAGVNGSGATYGVADIGANLNLSPGVTALILRDTYGGALSVAQSGYLLKLLMTDGTLQLGLRGDGAVFTPNLPTVDPHEVGRWWKNGAAINISAG